MNHRPNPNDPTLTTPTLYGAVAQLGKGFVLEVIWKGDLLELFSIGFLTKFFVIFLTEVFFEEFVVAGGEEFLENGIARQTDDIVKIWL